MKEKTGRGVRRSSGGPWSYTKPSLLRAGLPGGKKGKAGVPGGERIQCWVHGLIDKLLADTSIKPEDGWVVMVKSKMRCGLGGIGEQGLDVI